MFIPVLHQIGKSCYYILTFHTFLQKESFLSPLNENISIEFLFKSTQNIGYPNQVRLFGLKNLSSYYIIQFNYLSDILKSHSFNLPGNLL